MINLVGGTSSRRIVLSFMIATATLSMWISNTATTIMMLPIALAVIAQSPDKKLAVLSLFIFSLAGKQAYPLYETRHGKDFLYRLLTGAIKKEFD